MFGNRVLRLSAAALVVGAAGMTLAPHATSYVATSAVVNAPVIQIKAPFDGVVRRASAAIADPVQSGETLLALAADRADRTALAALEAERTTIRGEADSLGRMRADFAALEADLNARRATHVAEYSGWLDARAAAAAARTAGARVRLAQAHADFQRNAKLAETGSVAATLLEDDRAEAGAAEAELARAEAEARALDLERHAIGAGVALDDAGGSFAQIAYRLDEIALRRAETDRAEAALAARLDAVETQIATLGRRADTREFFAPDANAVGVIWKASPPEGMPVMTGDEVARVLDCGRRFLEVAIPERLFERIRTGSPAWIRLKGAEGWFTAEVEAVRGAGGRFDRPALAAVVPRDDESQLSVLVRLPPADVSRPEVAHAFCDVGRTADVRFDRASEEFVSRIRRIWEGVAARAASLQIWIGAQTRRTG